MTGVRTSDGTVIEAGLVLVGVGIVPNTRLAEQAGLEVDNGIVVDEMLRTSDPDVFAAGDVANAFNPLFGARLRVEHWANAANQGKAAGASMAGAGEPYAKLPYFFTDQYDLSMEYHGFVDRGGADRVVLRGDPSGDGAWTAFWLRDGRVLAGMNVNDWDAADDIKRLARERSEVDPAVLGDPGTPLADLSPLDFRPGDHARVVAGERAHNHSCMITAGWWGVARRLPDRGRPHPGRGRRPRQGARRHRGRHR